MIPFWGECPEFYVSWSSWKIWHTRRYGALWASTSSSCGGLVAFRRLEGPSVPKRNTGKCFERPANILRGMQSYVPKRNTGKCLLTVGNFNASWNIKFFYFRIASQGAGWMQRFWQQSQRSWSRSRSTDNLVLGFWYLPNFLELSLGNIPSKYGMHLLK